MTEDHCLIKDLSGTENCARFSIQDMIMSGAD